MVVVVTAVSGPASGTSFTLDPGQIYEVGRNERLDCPVPSDTSLSDTHFALQSLGSACRVSDLGSRAGTLVNGQRIAEAVARSGDRVSAGQSVFQVSVEPDAVGSPGPPVPETEETALDFSQRMQLTLSDDAVTLLDDQSPLGFWHALLEAELYTDALRFLTHRIAKPDAVRWAVECVSTVAGEHLSDPEQSTLMAARNWATAPGEQLRRVAEAWADYVGSQSAAGMVALGAFWSGGSLSPPDVAVVPPADNLTGKALFGGLMIAAAAGNKPAVTQRVQHFLQAARNEFDLELPSGEAGS